jgi:hypothetical protein
MDRNNNRLPALILTAILFTGCLRGHAQNASFLADGIDGFIRRSQLLGTVSTQSGLMVKSFVTNNKAIDSLLPWKSRLQIAAGVLGRVDILPVSVLGQGNSHHPYGWNDGGMIPARGMQTALTAGLLFTSGHFSVQLRPELIYAQNSAFETFSSENDNSYWIQYYRRLNNSDIPERFGDGPYQKVYAGQSSFRFNTGSMSIGISTENMWWGPGTRNALVMSNNAPGFLHATINTTRPIQTGIGTFEGQLIGGTLAASDVMPPETHKYDGNGRLLYSPKRQESRYIAGMTVSWQPKWVAGLFVGFAKASYQYQSDISGIADILPLEGIIKSSSEKSHRKAAVGSLFARYVMPEEKAELYIEYGRSDKSPNLVNLAADNGYPRAYVAGFRKLFGLKTGAYIEFHSEFTQMHLPTSNLVLSGQSWYTDTVVRHGYTHEGQLLGAALGPGSNSEMIDISWVKGFNKLGLMFERVLHDNDFYYRAFSYPVDFSRHWVDLSTTAHMDWRYKNFLLSSQFAIVRSLNYQWYIFPALGYFKNGYDVLNFHARLSLSYRL